MCAPPSHAHRSSRRFWLYKAPVSRRFEVASHRMAQSIITQVSKESDSYAPPCPTHSTGSLCVVTCYSICCSNFAFFLHSLVGHCVFHKSDPSTLTNTCLQPNPCGFNDVFRVEWMHCRGFSTVVVYEVLLCSCDDMCTCTCTCVRNLKLKSL